jgi:hypothetical protein
MSRFAAIRRMFPARSIKLLALPALALPALGAIAALAAVRDEDQRTADHLAAMLRAGRTVISEAQDRINDPDLGPKGLDGQTVLDRTVAIFRRSTGTDLLALNPATREGRLLRFQMAAIREVMDTNRASLDASGVGFKGFIPAVFARLVNEAFNERAKGEATMRVTAPLALVRNRKSRPDPWEAGVIREYFDRTDWPVGRSFEAQAEAGSRPAFRIAVPEYYAASCLACHGGPKGQVDITGYPREGAALDQLGGVISIALYR